MAMDKFLLDILVCPEDKTAVKLADDATISKLNELITQGKLLNRAKNPVKDKIDGGLVRADRKILYPIRQDIPIMLIEEGIELA